MKFAVSDKIRNFVAMKPNQASIYREIERLLEWTIPVADRLPKSVSWRELGGLLVRDLKESLDFVVLAFQTEDRLERLECLNGLVMRMTSVKTTFRLMHRVRRDILSHGQHAQMLDMMNSISDQAGKWLRKTKYLIAEERQAAEQPAVVQPEQKPELRAQAEPRQRTLFDDVEGSR